MKSAIKVTALLLLAGTSIFATTPAKALKDEAPATISSTVTAKGIAVKATEKSIVMIYDQDNNVLRKDILAAGKSPEKAYVLNQLDNGKYTIEVISGKQNLKKSIYVYDEGKDKTFVVQQ